MRKSSKAKRLVAWRQLTQRKDGHADPTNLHVHIAAVGQSDQVCWPSGKIIGQVCFDGHRTTCGHQKEYPMKPNRVTPQHKDNTEKQNRCQKKYTVNESPMGPNSYHHTTNRSCCLHLPKWSTTILVFGNAWAKDTKSFSWSWYPQASKISSRLANSLKPLRKAGSDNKCFMARVGWWLAGISIASWYP